VAKAVKVIEKSGLEYRITAMGTILKVNSFEELGKLVDEIIKSLRDDCPRVYIVVKADERFRDVEIDYKVKSVEDKLGRSL
jgi:uncharacterized protein YqgV (UPF0045/DUF77 family)